MSPTRLRLLLSLFFGALLLPSSILVYQAYGQLKWEAFHQHQQLARELTLRIDASFSDLLKREENRPITDFEFLNVSGSKGASFVQPSPLSVFPLESEVPGLLGYFQVDGEGELSTPIMPLANAADYGISAVELDKRSALQQNIRKILDQNRLLAKADLVQASDVGQSISSNLAPLGLIDEKNEQEINQPQALFSRPDFTVDSKAQMQKKFAFDELASKKNRRVKDYKKASKNLKDLKLVDEYKVASAKAEKKPTLAKFKKSKPRVSRKEQVQLAEIVAAKSGLADSFAAAADQQDSTLQSRARFPNIRIQSFESEVEPMKFSYLDSGHFVLYRRVWHRDGPMVQGLLIDQARFIETLITPAFNDSSLSEMSELIIAYRGEILKKFSPNYERSLVSVDEQLGLLYQSRLIAPFSELELVYTLGRFSVGAGGKVILWSAFVLGIVLMGGFLMLYRLGLRQIALAGQQQDFVSAVSHELKTPLTSIRMYGEMLREGWADESKLKSYYDFIFHESERLSRLINNLLQLARLSKNEQTIILSKVSIESALEQFKPGLISQLKPTGFRLSLTGEENLLERQINIDIDAFIQIFTNLVDNAVKFSNKAEIKTVDIRYQLMADAMVQFSVRDYGPGIAADQLKKIFQLFYRGKNELTRETVGTGIGLALVQQLGTAMRCQIDVLNTEPGSEFRLRFNLLDKKV